MENWLSLGIVLIILSVILVIAVAVVVFLASRLARPHVLTVRDARGNVVDGIPFYLKRGRRVQETAYLESLATVTLSLVEITGAGNAETAAAVLAASRTVSLSSDAAARLGDLQTAVASGALSGRTAGDPKAAWDSAWTALQALPAYSGGMPLTSEHVLPVIANSVREESVVDYDQQYTINATMPLIGSTELAAELAADGTLSKVSAKAEDTTLATVIGGLPTSKDVLGLMKVDTGDEKSIVAPPGSARYDIRLTVERHFVRHWLRRPVAGAGFPAPIGQDEFSQVAYERDTGEKTPPPTPAPAKPAAETE